MMFCGTSWHRLPPYLDWVYPVRSQAVASPLALRWNSNTTITSKALPGPIGSTSQLTAHLTFSLCNK